MRAAYCFCGWYGKNSHVNSKGFLLWARQPTLTWPYENRFDQRVIAGAERQILSYLLTLNVNSNPPAMNLFVTPGDYLSFMATVALYQKDIDWLKAQSIDTVFVVTGYTNDANGVWTPTESERLSRARIYAIFAGRGMWIIPCHPNVMDGRWWSTTRWWTTTNYRAAVIQTASQINRFAQEILAQPQAVLDHLWKDDIGRRAIWIWVPDIMPVADVNDFWSNVLSRTFWGATKYWAFFGSTLWPKLPNGFDMIAPYCSFYHELCKPHFRHLATDAPVRLAASQLDPIESYFDRMLSTYGPERVVLPLDFRFNNFNAVLNCDGDWDWCAPIIEGCEDHLAGIYQRLMARHEVQHVSVVFNELFEGGAICPTEPLVEYVPPAIWGLSGQKAVVAIACRETDLAEPMKLTISETTYRQLIQKPVGPMKLSLDDTRSLTYRRLALHGPGKGGQQ